MTGQLDVTMRDGPVFLFQISRETHLFSVRRQRVSYRFPRTFLPQKAFSGISSLLRAFTTCPTPYLPNWAERLQIDTPSFEYVCLIAVAETANSSGVDGPNTFDGNDVETLGASGGGCYLQMGGDGDGGGKETAGFYVYFYGRRAWTKKKTDQQSCLGTTCGCDFYAGRPR